MINEKTKERDKDIKEKKVRTGGKNAVRALSLAAITVVLLILAQALLVPKYASFPYEGGMVREYYSATTQHDVVFFGDCEFYESISPVTLWEEYGISSYVRGSSQQLIWQSYYMLLDTLEYEKPKVVVFNAMEMKIGSVQKEEYTRLTLDGMKLSRFKLAAAKESLTEGETLLSYVIPLMRYHSRWSDLTGDDVRYMFEDKAVSYNGYLMNTGVKAQTGDVWVDPLGFLNTAYDTDPTDDSVFSPVCWEYLDKMRLLCEEEGIEFVLFKAPTQSAKYYWYDEWEAEVKAYAEAHGVPYLNGIEVRSEMGLDMTTDTYDAGEHLNVYGAEKCSSYLGKWLAERFDIEDRRGESELAAAWAVICSAYREEKGSAETNG